MDAARRIDLAWNAAPAEDRGVAPLFTIDEEAASDVAAREHLLDRAMGPMRKRKSSEQIRRGRLPAKGLALAARAEDGTLVGTVRLWHVTLGEGGARALLLGPLAVEPSMKSAGIGSRLMREAIARASDLGHAAILLVGDPEYYGRFGFSAEKTGDLAMPGPFEKRRLLALELQPGALDGAAGVIAGCGDLIPHGRASHARRARVA